MIEAVVTLVASVVTAGVFVFVYMALFGANYSRLSDEQAKRPFLNGNWK